MFFEKYIDEDVIIKLDRVSDLIEGRLIGVIPECLGKFGGTLVLDCLGQKREIATVDLVQFFSKKDLLNDDVEYYYVILRYGKTERSKEHIYMSYDHSIKPGDKVLLWRDWLYVGNVIRTGFFKKGNAPYPVEKTWFVEKKVYDRIDFMKYDDSSSIIKEDNLYKDNYLNAENHYKQYLAKTNIQYQWLKDDSIAFLERRKPNYLSQEDMTDYIIQETEEELTGYWPESNQIDVFYQTLWMCSYIAKNGGYDKRLFDTYICMSLIYKHGDFDNFILAPKYDKINIERDIIFLDNYIKSIH